MKSDWVKILTLIVTAIIVFGVIWGLTRLFGGGPLKNAFDKTLGLAVRTLEGLESGCTPQSDCKTLKSKDTGVKASDCTWTEKICVNPSGRKPNPNGGFFSLSCGLGIALIAAFVGTLLLKGIGLFLQTKSEAVKAVIEVSGKSESDVLNSIVQTSRERFEVASESIETKSDAAKQSIAEAVIHQTTKEVATSVTQAGQTSEEAAQMEKVISEAGTAARAAIKEANERINEESGGSTDITKDINKASEQVPIRPL